SPEASSAVGLHVLRTERVLSRAPPAVAPDSLRSRFPCLVAFACGLLHGFEFAGSLAEVGPPQHAVPLALLFFNVGVEIGQLVFVAVVLALAWLWRRADLPVPGAWPRAAAYAVGTISAFWAIERTAAVF